MRIQCPDQTTGVGGTADDDSHSAIAALYDAEPGTCYLLRPDLHIAGRWKVLVADEILHTARLCLGKA